MSEKIEFRYEITNIKEIKHWTSRGKKHTEIEMESAGGFALPVHFKAQVGDEIEVYMWGSRIVGLFVKKVCVYFQSKKALDEENKAYSEKREKEQNEDFAKNKDKYDKWFSEMPEVFQRRIQVFRDNGKNWRVEWEGYEMSSCREAINIAKHYPTKELLEKFRKEDSESYGKTDYKPLDDGHSGNTWGMAKRLAWWYVTEPENVFKEHGAATPLVGCEEYGCIHPR